jgi:hypothetical protein
MVIETKGPKSLPEDEVMSQFNVVCILTKYFL